MPGEYNLEVFVETVNNVSYKIFEQKLTVTESLYKEVLDNRRGIYYDWEPNSKAYHAHLASLLLKSKH